ncbi:MAG: hypothetical protein ACR2JT_06185, partial [Nocardioidaceae bacterium]
SHLALLERTQHKVLLLAHGGQSVGALLRRCYAVATVRPRDWRNFVASLALGRPICATRQSEAQQACVTRLAASS